MDNKITKQAIIEEVAKRHYLILDDKDPILAVVTANEVIFEELISKADILFTKHLTELESYKSSLVKEIGEMKKELKASIPVAIETTITSQGISRKPEPMDTLSQAPKKADEPSIKLDKTHIKQYYRVHIYPVIAATSVGVALGLVINYLF